MKESKLSLKTKQKNIGLPSSELPESSKNIVWRFRYMTYKL